MTVCNSNMSSEGEGGGLGAAPSPPPPYCFNMSAVTTAAAEKAADEAVVFWVEGVALGLVATAGVIGTG